ncbi:peptidase C65 Otubain-domain-containing protein [Coprinopsis sp. MPI-PUGE-AT-0042]|nr:peptidase C65 Otubain-domain-containing protein [Coprinopsis sp. MPI-PUGE-AT-0042]
MSEPAATTDDGRELSTAEIYERNQKLLDESIPDVPLVSDLLPMAALRAEYENGSAAYRSQIDWLVAQGYTGIRRARGDGDCFYRSLAFAYIERLLQTPPEELEVSVASSLSILQGTRQTILLAGTDEFILEDPYEMITSIIQNIVTPNSKGNTLTPEKLLARFQDQGAGSMDAEDEPVAAYIVYYLRMITSAHIKNNAADYEPFFEDGISARDFCSRQVDPVGIEADHIQMGALCKELKVNLKVAYLDGHQSDKVDFVTFDEGPSGGDPITLLYRYVPLSIHWPLLIADTLYKGQVTTTFLPKEAYTDCYKHELPIFYCTLSFKTKLPRNTSQENIA